MPDRRVTALGCAIGAIAFAMSTVSAMADTEHSMQGLSSSEFGWSANNWDFLIPPPEGAGHGPIGTDPAYPYTTQIQNGGRVFDPLQVPIVDTKDAILKPWAAKQMQETNEEIHSGKRKLPFMAQSRCWPGGIPGQLLFLEPVYFAQVKGAVWMIWQRDNFARRIALTQKHSENLKPTWWGESIGHYEGDNALVVDTIGISAKSFIDSFRTPHTDKLHVVERYTLSPDGRTLKAVVTLDDPDTFNGKLTLTQTWRKNEIGWGESICAEDGGKDVFNFNLHPIPVAQKPDF
jgi:hypothetical protein